MGIGFAMGEETEAEKAKYFSQGKEWLTIEVRLFVMIS